MSALYPILSQRTYPGVGDVDDCAVIATFWAARAAGYLGPLPTIAEFRAAAGVPDLPGPSGLTNAQVWAGVQGTSLATLAPTNAQVWAGVQGTSLATLAPGLLGMGWDAFALMLKAGGIASVQVDSSKLPSAVRYNFLGIHRVGIAWRAGWWIANPLAADGTAPQWISEWALKAAMGTVRAVVFPPQEAPVVIVTNPTPRMVHLGAGVQLLDLNARPLVKVSVAQDAYSPFTAGDYRAIVVTTGGARQLALVATGDVTDVQTIGDVRRPVRLTAGDIVLWEGDV